MSTCTTGNCPHGRGVFIWTADGPWYGDPSDPDHGKYPRVHDTTLNPGCLEVCDLIPFTTPAEAGTVCYECGHDFYRHEQPAGPIVYGVIRDPGKCADCGCDRMRYAPAVVREFDPGSPENRLMLGEPVRGAPGACSREGCAHSKLWHRWRREDSPVKGRSACCRCPGWTDEPGAVMPPEPEVQLSLFGDETA